MVSGLLYFYGYLNPIGIYYSGKEVDQRQRNVHEAFFTFSLPCLKSNTMASTICQS